MAKSWQSLVRFPSASGRMFWSGRFSIARFLRFIIELERFFFLLISRDTEGRSKSLNTCQFENLEVLRAENLKEISGLLTRGKYADEWRGIMMQWTGTDCYYKYYFFLSEHETKSADKIFTIDYMNNWMAIFLLWWSNFLLSRWHESFIFCWFRCCCCCWCVGEHVK